MKSKFLTFRQEVDCWIVISNKNKIKLGQIEYYIPWKKWIFWSYSADYIYDSECLKGIAKFLEDL